MNVLLSFDVYDLNVKISLKCSILSIQLLALVPFTVIIHFVTINALL